MHLMTTLLLSNPPPLSPQKRANCAAPNQRQIQFKSTNLVSRGRVATEPSRPRIQRFAWQLILALDVNDLGDFALFVKPTRWTLVFTFLSHCWGRCFAPQSYETEVRCNWKNFNWFGLSANKRLTWLMKCSGMWPHSNLGDHKVMYGSISR